ncbi:MAG: rhomboid family intramembrane serine protease [Deltaproteobacteria bacterium]|nr:rhomboid family intramembrane serine protease [Deltaproteobacteria bacterium]
MAVCNLFVSPWQYPSSFIQYVSAKYFILLIGAIELISSVFYTTDGIAHIAHLGGMVAGYLYIMYKVKRPPLNFRNWFQKSSKSKPKFKIIEGGHA